MRNPFRRQPRPAGPVELARDQERQRAQQQAALRSFARVVKTQRDNGTMPEPDPDPDDQVFVCGVGMVSVRLLLTLAEDGAASELPGQP